jgi:hypothetical protein
VSSHYLRRPCGDSVAVQAFTSRALRAIMEAAKAGKTIELKP